MNIVLPSKENMPSILEDMCLKFDEEIKKFTYPVLAKYKDNEYLLFGSCLAVSVDGSKFLCTATHLVTEIMKEDAIPVVGIGGDFHSIDCQGATLLSEKGIDHDICLIKIDPGIEGINFVHGWDIYQGDKFFNEARQYILGFPVSKNKRWNLHNHEEKTIETGCLRGLVKVDQTLSSPFDYVSEKSHYLFKYDGGVYKKEGGDFKISKHQNMPELFGFSGAGLWNIYNINDLSSLRLAGILISHKSKVVAATKARNIERIYNNNRTNQASGTATSAAPC